MNENVVKIGDKVYFNHDIEADGGSGLNGFLGVKSCANIFNQRKKEKDLDWGREIEQNTYDKPLEIFKPCLIEQDNIDFEENLIDLPQGEQWRCRFLVTGPGKVGQPVRYTNAIKLKHMGSERYLSLSKSESVQGLNLKLSLKDDDPSCNFKILPKYKLRTDGEFVFYDDTIILFNVFHSLSIDYQVENGEFISKSEILLSPKPLGWQIRKFYLNKEEELLNDLEKGAIPIRAGDLCSLFHRELEGFVTARINDGESLRNKVKSPIDYIFEDFLPTTNSAAKSHERYNLHLKTSSSFSKNKINKDPYTIFSFEHESASDGSLITWNQPFRLFHISSRNWLQVKQGQVVLSRERNEKSLFEFRPIISENQCDIVTYNSCAKLMNLNSEKFICCLQRKAPGINKEELDRLDEHHENLYENQEDHSFELNKDEEEEEEVESNDQEGEDEAERNDQVEEEEEEEDIQTSYLGSDTGEARDMRGALDHSKSQAVNNQKYHKKEKELRAIGKVADNDAFVIQPINKRIITQLQTISAHKKLLQFYLEEMVEKIKTEDGLKTVELGLLKGLNYAIKSLIIEITSKDKADFLTTYNELKKTARYHRPSKIIQSLMIGEYLIHILIKITSDIWKSTFKNYYEQKLETKTLKESLILRKILGDKYTEMENICQLSHLLLKLIVYKKRRSAIIFKEYKIINLLIEQLITPWDLCITDLFKIPGIQEKYHIKILKKKEITMLIDTLYVNVMKDRHNPKLFRLLANICTPGGKGDKKLQNNILDAIVGNPVPPDLFKLPVGVEEYVWDIRNSCFIFYINPKDAANPEEGYVIYLSTKSGTRPPNFIFPPHSHPEAIIYEKENEEIEDARYLMDLSAFLSTDSKIENNLEKQEVKLNPRLNRKKKYFKAQLRLFTALTQNYNEHCQEIIRQLLPPELLIYCLNSQINLKFKTLFMELLINLYIKYHLLSKPPVSLIPKVLLWNKGEKADEILDDQRNKNISERIKLFSLTYFNKDFNIKEQESFQIADDREIEEDLEASNIWDQEPGEIGEEVGRTKQPIQEFTTAQYMDIALQEPHLKEVDIVLEQVIIEKNTLKYSVIKELLGEDELRRKKLENWPNIYKSRIGLHNFIISTLESPVSWSLKKVSLKFFVTYFKLLNLLMLRKFFSSDYNDYLIEELRSIMGTEIEELLRESRNSLKFEDYMRKNIQAPVDIGQSLPYDYFFIALKSNLIQKLKHCSTKYFLNEENKSDIKTLVSRYEGLDSSGHYMGKLKLQICHSLDIIYSKYLGHTLVKVWEVFSGLLRKWIAESKVKKKPIDSMGFTIEDVVIEGTEEEKNLENAKMLFGQIFNELGEKDNNNLSLRKLIGSKIIGSSDSISERIETEYQDEKDYEVQVSEYKPLTNAQSKKAILPINKFVNDYLQGNFSDHVLGNLRQLDKEDIVHLLSDMLLHNKNTKLNIIAMDLLHLHMNQFRYLLSKIGNLLILTGQEDEETFDHIVELQHSFEILVSSDKLTKDEGILQQIIDIFVVPPEQLNDPGLTEICYTKLWGYKCKSCQRWYRTNKRELKYRTNTNKEQFTELATECFESHENEDSKLPIYTRFDIVAKNQELLRNAKIHLTILAFLYRKKDLDVYSRKLTLQTKVIDHCLDFLYYFIKNHEVNSMALTNVKWVNMFCNFLDNNYFRPKVLKILTELLESNHQGNLMIKNDTITQIIQEMTDENCKSFCKYIKLLMKLTESEFGIIKEKQSYIITEIDRSMPKENLELLLLKQYDDDSIVNELFKMDENIRSENNEPDMVTSGLPDLSPMNHDENSLLYKHLQFIDLLAHCAKGRHVIVEDILIKFISHDRVQQIIAATKLPFYIRLPYLHLLRGMCLSKELNSEMQTKLKIDDVIKDFVSPKFIDTFRDMIKEWSAALENYLIIYEEKEQLILKGLRIDNQKDREENIFQSKFGDYSVINVILPTISDMFKPGNLEELICNSGTKSHEEGEEIKIGDLKADLEVDESELESDEEVMLQDIQKAMYTRIHQKIRNNQIELLMQNEQTKQFMNILKSWIQNICKMAQNHLIISTENRRECILKTLTSFEKNYEENKLGRLLEAVGPDRGYIERVTNRLKIINSRDMEEDIQLQNQKMRQRYIKKTCMPELIRLTSITLVDVTLKAIEDPNERHQICILTHNMVDNEITIPEFYYFVKYFREKLFSYERYRNHKSTCTESLSELGGTFFLKNNKKKIIQCRIEERENPFATEIEIDGIKYFIHEKYNEYTQEGGQIFINIIKHLRNLKRKAHRNTDAGLLKMMQAILILQVIRLGLTVVSYGNRGVQNNFLEAYKYSLSNQKAGQNFLQGMKKIINLGKRSYLSKNRDILLEMTYLFNSMFIQNLCEGQNKTMKDFLREQQYIKVDVDIVSILAKSCDSMTIKLFSEMILVEDKVAESLRIPYIINQDKFLYFIDWSKLVNVPDAYDFLKLRQVLKTMTELSQGPCLANQSTFIKSNVVSSLCKLLQCIGSYFYEGLIDNQNFRGWHEEDMRIIATTIEKNKLAAEATQITNSLAVATAKKAHINRKSTSSDIVKTKHMFEKLLLQIEGSILIFIKSLIEGRTSGMDSQPEHIEDMEHLTELLSADTIIENLNTHMNNNKYAADDDMFQKQIKLIKESNIFHYFSFLTLYQEINSSKACKPTITTKFEMWKSLVKTQKLDKIMGRCEIINEDQNIDVVYFPIPDNVTKYWDTSVIHTQIDNLISTVSRDNPEEKVKDFLIKSEDLIQAVHHRARIAKVTNKLPIIGRFLDWSLTAKTFWLWAALIFVIGLNVDFLFTYKIEKECPEEYKLAEGKCEDGKKESEIEHIDNYPLTEIITVITLLLFLMLIIIEFTNYTLLNIIKRLKELDKENDPTGQANCLGKLKYKCKQACYISYEILFDINFDFHFVMLVVLIIGIFYFKALIATTMLVIIYENRLSRYVITSIFDHWDTFLITLAVGIICFYWFTVIAFFSSWRAEYALEDQMACDTLWECFRIHMDYGFMAFPVWNEAPLPLEAVVFNFLWVLVCNLCLTAIISGIIIDSFGEKRAAKEALDEDTKNYCFICNIERDEFEKCKIEFDDHIYKKHNMWHYVWFIMHLEATPREDYTGVEEYIWELKQTENIAFFPIKQCLEMQDFDSTKKKDLRALFDNVSKGFQSLTNLIKDDLPKMIANAIKEKPTLTDDEGQEM